METPRRNDPAGRWFRFDVLLQGVSPLPFAPLSSACASHGNIGDGRPASHAERPAVLEKQCLVFRI